MENRPYRRVTNIVSMLVIFTFLFSFTNPDRTLAAPPPPPVPAQPAKATPPPVKTGTQSAPPAPSIDSPQIDQARAKAAIDLTLKKYLAYFGPRYQAAVSAVAVDSGWAIGSADWQSSAKLLPGSIQILAHKQSDGGWQAVMPGSDNEYLPWLNSLPDKLASTSGRALMRAHAVNGDAIRLPQAKPAVPPA